MRDLPETRPLRDQPIVVTVAEWRRQIIALAGIAAVVLLGAALTAAADLQGWF